jgi:hypothetical protein
MSVTAVMVCLVHARRRALWVPARLHVTVCAIS